jgi:hypothetical protein
MDERKDAPGVPYEDSTFITEADVELEIQNQLLQEFASLSSPASDSVFLTSAASQIPLESGRDQVVLSANLTVEDEEGQGSGTSSKADEGLATDFQGDLQGSIHLSDSDEQDVLPFAKEADNKILQSVRVRTTKARDCIVRKYSKAHTINQFQNGNVVTIKLPRRTRTSTNNQKVYGRVLAVPRPNRYKLQTEYGVIEQLLLTKELERVPLSMGIVVNGPNTKVTLSKVALEASTSDRVVVSCKCKGLCNTQHCQCFKEQKNCSIHCHGGDDDHDCGFLASMALRTEKALVSRAKAKAKVDSGSGSGLGLRSGKRARANTAGDAVD